MPGVVFAAAALGGDQNSLKFDRELGLAAGLQSSENFEANASAGDNRIVLIQIDVF